MSPAHEIGAVPAPKGNLIVPWTLIQRWAIDEVSKPGPQRIQTFVIETVAWRDIKATLCVQLMVRDGLDEKTEKSICDAFAAYQYPGSGDVDIYVENCLHAFYQLWNGCCMSKNAHS